MVSIRVPPATETKGTVWNCFVYSSSFLPSLSCFLTSVVCPLFLFFFSSLMKVLLPITSILPFFMHIPFLLLVHSPVFSKNSLPVFGIIMMEGNKAKPLSTKSESSCKTTHKKVFPHKMDLLLKETRNQTNKQNTKQNDKRKKKTKPESTPSPPLPPPPKAQTTKSWLFKTFQV